MAEEQFCQRCKQTIIHDLVKTQDELETIGGIFSNFEDTIPVEADYWECRRCLNKLRILRRKKDPNSCFSEIP